MKKFFAINIPIVTLTTMAILTLTSFLQIGKPYEPDKMDLIGALTFHFLHGNDLHLFSNLLGLCIAGFIIERHEKANKTLKLYFTLWFIISLAVYSIGWIFYIVPVIGSSGFVYALFGYVLFHIVKDLRSHLKRKKLVSYVLAILYLCAFLFLIFSFFNEILMATRETQANIAHIIHVVGFVIGAMIYSLRHNILTYSREDRKEC